jgi:uncharacterized protein YqgV (UPF0045/DUF77 family)
MRITVDVSMYPLDQDYKPQIKEFIRSLRRCSGLELITNQMSTQVRGDFDAVTAAINACMKQAMQGNSKTVFVTKFINVDLEIQAAPDIGEGSG